MTVHNLFMAVVNLNCFTPVTAYDKRNNLLSCVENWGDLEDHYSKSDVLLFNYELGEIHIDKTWRE